MGGLSSGKYNKYKSKPTTTSYAGINLRKVRKLFTLEYICGFTLEWKKRYRKKNCVGRSHLTDINIK